MENPQPFNETIFDTVKLEGDKDHRCNEILFFKEFSQLLLHSRQRSKAAASSLLYLSQLQTLTLRATVLLMADVIFPARLPHEGSNEQLGSSSAGKKSWRPDLDAWCWLFSSQSRAEWAGGREEETVVQTLAWAKGSLLARSVNKNAQCRQPIWFSNKTKVEGLAGWSGGFVHFPFK